MSSLTAWLSEFRLLHEKARRGQMKDRELSLYRNGRDELARALLAAQRLQLKAGEVPRRALRVARALQVDLDFAVAAARAVTLDISSGGFSCLLARSAPAGEEVRFTMRIPEAESFAGRALIKNVKPLQGAVRVSFEFVGLSEAEKERLELFVFDTVMGQLTPP